MFANIVINKRCQKNNLNGVLSAELNPALNRFLEFTAKDGGFYEAVALVPIFALHLHIPVSKLVLICVGSLVSFPPPLLFLKQEYEAEQPPYPDSYEEQEKPVPTVQVRIVHIALLFIYKVPKIASPLRSLKLKQPFLQA